VKIKPIRESVVIPHVVKFIAEEEICHPTEEMDKSAGTMPRELLLWARGLNV
jgi:hypothetical protein